MNTVMDAADIAAAQRRAAVMDAETRLHPNHERFVAWSCMTGDGKSIVSGDCCICSGCCGHGPHRSVTS